ncbi:glycoside hydrolase family 15 protein [Ascoidea rubescens DSM 1968]|uniref:glucan 1,4-alpha-glucosidase n=1 Tax=Ascoidea rubescens DSM 1968 TaxID=1344418 RepID=A0A1D2VM71_9ASCO|nr:glycoside hydrolase family 15 protein [Ascoidea rubescens DSM 1968]ODV62674.1 glycoside hydrolase family 15 protein [Ascoidea rubescens DSM 1968]
MIISKILFSLLTLLTFSVANVLPLSYSYQLQLLDQKNSNANSKYFNLLNYFNNDYNSIKISQIPIKSQKFIPNQISRDDRESWIQEQKTVSFRNILNNIGGSLTNISNPENNGVSVGAVIASPSKVHPDYFYQWTRDAAITMLTICDYLQDDNFQNISLIDLMESYIDNNYYLQRLSNPSGDFDDLSGLGEAKFHVNNTAFMEHWGRPQRDGPALRAITTIKYIDLLNKFNNGEIKTDDKIFNSTADIYNLIIKPDLEYVAKYWNKKSFDLWEEIDSFHFFTSMVQLRSLYSGAQLALKFNDNQFYYYLMENARSLNDFVVFKSGYKQPSLDHLVETPSLYLSNHRSGLDSAIIIASILTHDFDLDVNHLIPFDINDPLILGTLYALISDMKYRYAINHNLISLNLGVGIGRYPEDIYDGTGFAEGNPWFLSTSYAAELFYKIVYSFFNNAEDLRINPANFKFYKENIINFNQESIENDIILPFKSSAFNATVSNLLSYADSFLDVVHSHVSDEGSISEQFDRYSGYMKGASDLTWSYGSLWNAFRWREKVLVLF